jgi:isocitrate dehydrogenase kinase/phosphatase
MSAAQREALLQAHGEIFDVTWWQELQARNRAGDFIDVPPYPERTRLGGARP